MTLRVFAAIWGALVLTLLLFGLLVATLNLTPPKGALAAAEQRVVERELSLVASRDGTAAALSYWAKVSDAHPLIDVRADVSCTGGRVVRGSDGSCLEFHTTAQDDQLLEGLRMLIPPLLVGVAVSAGAALLLSRHLTRPIRTVDAALQRLAGGDLDTRIGAALHQSGGELIRLGEAFDNAAERLQTLSNGQRRLFNDLSHEIRSPLARLQAAVGLLEISPDRLTEMLYQIETDILRLDRLVRDILTLARYGSAEAHPAKTRLDLVDILEPILSDANFEGQPRGVGVSYAGPARIELIGRGELLHSAIENVVRNAIAHSPDDGQVTVHAQQKATSIILDISDQGPGVPASERSRLLEPFIRLQDRTAKGGSGLGLAIAERAIVAHDGTIELLDNVPQGLCVRISLPGLPKSSRLESKPVGGAA